MPLLDEAKVHLDALGAANRAFMQVYPGDRAARQPVHTVYGGAQLFKAETTSRLGAVARATHGRATADSPAEFARGVGFTDRSRTAGWPRPSTSASAASSNASRSRTSASTSRTASAPAPTPRKTPPRSPRRARSRAACARALLPPFLGIRIKSMGEEWKARSARTLEIFLDTLLGETGGQPARQLRRHAAQGHRRRAAADAGAAVRDPRAPARPGRGHAALRDDDRGHAGDHRRRRPLAAARLPRRLRGPLRRRPLRHLRLHRVVQRHRGVPGDGSPVVRPGQGPHAAGLRRHRHLPLRRIDQRAAGRRRTPARR